MAAARRSRLYALLGVSLLAHAGILAVLGLREPKLSLAPAPPVMEVQVVPYYVLPTPRRSEAERLPPLAERPIRPRRTLRPDESSPVAPLVTPRAPPPAERGPWTLEQPAPGGAPAPPADLRQALRRGPAGCANPALLSREEREACEERLGAGAKDAPFLQPPMDPRKRQAFDEAAAKKEAYQRYKRGNVPPGITHEPRPSEAPNPFPEVWTPRR
ncbi:MAG: hypothetical protein KBC34_04615 [Phenylobacterium sp.]|nr:hypothetical protein [Phenylobacterium sp.]